MKQILLGLTIIALAGCAGPAQSPEEVTARRAAGMDLMASECTIYVGGIQGIRELQQGANKQAIKARQMGASKALMQKAKADVRNNFNGAEAWAGKEEACQSFLTEIVPYL